MKALARALLAALAAAATARPAGAAPVVAVLSADHGAYRQALAGFEAVFGSSVTVRLASADASLDPDTRVVVAIGGRAALRLYPSDVEVIYCLAPAAAITARKATRVRMMPRPADLVSRVRLAQPAARSLAVVWSQSAYQSYVGRVIEEGRAAGLDVLSVPTDSSDLPRALAIIGGRASAVWLAPDPLLVTPDNFRIISAFAGDDHIPFYAPAVDLIREGATAAIAISPEDMGRAAAEAAQRYLSGEPPEEEVFSNRVRVVVNPARAAAVGLVLSTDVVKSVDVPPR